MSDPSPDRPAAVVVLAAGQGRRMQSATPKVLHPVAGRSLLGHAIEAARALNPPHLAVVVGHGRDAVTAVVADVDPAAVCVVQDQQLGTGHAVRTALEGLPPLSGTIVIMGGDTPLLTTATLERLSGVHAAEGNAATVLTACLPDPTGYGRVIRTADGGVDGIVEHKDATPGQLAVAEVSSGIFAFDAALLRDALGRLSRDNGQGEEYLPDVLGLLRDDDHRVGTVSTDPEEVLGVNDREQLAEAGRLLRDRIVRGWMRAGVTMFDPASVWVDVTVEIEPDAVLLPGVCLFGSTRIGVGAEIGPNVTMRDSLVGAGARVREATIEGAAIGERAQVGPYTYLRPGTRLAEGAKAGGFVEMKNADVGPWAKVPHLSYVGDARIGEGTNIGAATVFVNYDGVAKHRTEIGAHVRVGSDSMLIAPITIGDGAYTAAGSVITEDVPPGAMAVARGKQRNIDRWVLRRRPGSASAAAAARALAAGAVDPAWPSSDGGDASPSSAEEPPAGDPWQQQGSAQ